MTVVPSFPDRLRRMVGIFFNQNPINDNAGTPRRRETLQRLEYEYDTSECMKRILGVLNGLSEPMQLRSAEAILAMARSDRGAFIDIGDADPRDFRELTYGLVVFEESRDRRLSFRIPDQKLREELREMTVGKLIALTRPRRW